MENQEHTEDRDKSVEDRTSHRQVLQFLRPEVPSSPGNQPSSMRLLTPVGHSTPLTNPTRCPTRVITPNPAAVVTPSLEWDPLHECVEFVERESLLGGIQKLPRPSETNPNLLEVNHTEAVSAEESSIEFLDVDKSL